MTKAEFEKLLDEYRDAVVVRALGQFREPSTMSQRIANEDAARQRVLDAFGEMARKPECLLHLNSPAKLDALTKQYGVLPPWRTRPEADDYLPRYLAIDWSAVAAQYGGILIAPYQWKRRLELTWYYGWDCASGCAWDLSLIELEPILEVA